MVFGNIHPAGNEKAGKDSPQPLLWLLTQLLPLSFLHPQALLGWTSKPHVPAAGPSSHTAKPWGVGATRLPRLPSSSGQAVPWPTPPFPQSWLQINGPSACNLQPAPEPEAPDALFLILTPQFLFYFSVRA